MCSVYKLIHSGQMSNYAIYESYPHLFTGLSRKSLFSHENLYFCG